MGVVSPDYASISLQRRRVFPAWGCRIVRDVAMSLRGVYLSHHRDHAVTPQGLGPIEPLIGHAQGL
jgi:hypothetical protein